MCVLGLMLPLTAPCNGMESELTMTCVEDHFRWHVVCLKYQIVLQIKYSNRNNASYKQLLVSATSSSKYIMYSPQFNLPSIPLRLMLPLSPFYGWRNWDTVRLSNLPQDSQLRTDGIGTLAHSHVATASHSNLWSIWLSPTAVLALIITGRTMVIHICGYLKWWLMWSLEYIYIHIYIYLFIIR